MVPLQGYLFLLAASVLLAAAQYDYYDSDELFAREFFNELLRRDPRTMSVPAPAPASAVAPLATQQAALPVAQPGVQPSSQAMVQPAAHQIEPSAAQPVAQQPLGVYDRFRITMNKLARTEDQKDAAAMNPEYDAALHGKPWAERQKIRTDYKLHHGVSKLTELSERRKNSINAEWNERNADTAKAALGRHTVYTHDIDKLKTGLDIARTGAAVLGAITGAGVHVRRDLDRDWCSKYESLDPRDLYDNEEEFIWV